jgi:hypothetical protein
MGRLRPILKRAAWHLWPWSGLILGGTGWALTHQIGSILVQDKCPISSALLLAIICLAGLLLALGGGFLSWRLRRSGSAANETRSFLALVNALVAVLLAVAIFYQLLAALIIPRCFG